MCGHHDCRNTISTLNRSQLGLQLSDHLSPSHRKLRNIWRRFGAKDTHLNECDEIAAVNRMGIQINFKAEGFPATQITSKCILSSGRGGHRPALSSAVLVASASLCKKRGVSFMRSTRRSQSLMMYYSLMSQHLRFSGCGRFNPGFTQKLGENRRTILLWPRVISGRPFIRYSCKSLLGFDLQQFRRPAKVCSEGFSRLA